jgi:hypothetical protein
MLAKLAHLINLILKSWPGRILFVLVVGAVGWYAVESMMFEGLTLHDDTYTLGTPVEFRIRTPGERVALTIGRSNRPRPALLAWEVTDPDGVIVLTGRDGIARKARRVYFTPGKEGTYVLTADRPTPGTVGYSWITIRAGDQTIFKKFLSELGLTLTM